MKKVLFLLFAAIVFFKIVQAQDTPSNLWQKSPEFTIGANVVHPLDLSITEQNTILSNINAAGVRVIRIGFFAADTAKGIAFIQRAYAQHIKVLLIVHSQYALNAPIRAYQPKEFPGMWQGQPLSYADVKLSAAYFRQLLGKLDADGISLAGLELENEINHPGFNAEFPLPGEGRNFGLNDLYHDVEGQQIAKGYLQYLKVLTVLKQLRDHSKLNQYTPLISAGLSDTGPEGPWPTPKKYDAVSISATIRFLRANGLDSLVDAYGIHVYPWADSPGDKVAAVHRLRRLMQTALPECYPSDSQIGKPCWITEWGFTNDSTSCPSNEQARSLLVQEMMNDFRQLAKEGRLTGLLYYSWTGDRVWDVYRCGALTQTGKIALQPF